MNIIQDINVAIPVLQAIITFVEQIDPNAANNPVVQKINAAIAEINKVTNLL